jgi:hypothetical protein
MILIDASDCSPKWGQLIDLALKFIALKSVLLQSCKHA